MQTNQKFQQNILRYWRILELFEPQTVPQVQAHPREYETVQDLSFRDPLPWESIELPPQDPRYPKHRYEWSYYIYAGVFPQNLIFDELSAHISEEEEELKRPHDASETAIASFQVDHYGRLILGSVQLTTALWGLYRMHLLPTDHALSIDATNKELNDYLMHLEANRVRDDKGLHREDTSMSDLDLLSDQLPIGIDFLRCIHYLSLRAQKSPKTVNGKLSSLAEERLLRPVFRYKRIRIRVDNLDEDQKIDPDQLLGSFHLGDLDRAIKDAAEGTLSTPLQRYLFTDSQVQEISRRDIRRYQQYLQDGVAPVKTAMGRWPANPEHHLAMSQQFTVNKVRESQSHGSLLGVNGPPGTGKTTLVRDVYADLIVERARRLAELGEPQAGFTGYQLYKAPNGNEYRLSVLAQELRGFEMVVVSANNTAVENVSLELPQLDSVSDEFEGLSFFAEPASKVLSSKAQQKPAWGLAAARLGNRANCRDFKKKVWARFKDDDPKSLEEILKDPSGKRDWQQAVTAYREKEKRVKGLLNRAHQAEIHLEQLPKVRENLQSAEQNLLTAQNLYQQNKEEISFLERELQKVQAEYEMAQVRLQTQLAAKPGFWSNIMSWGKSHKTWYERYAEIEILSQKSESLLLEKRNHSSRLQSEEQRLIADIQKFAASAEAQRMSLLSLEQLLEQDRDFFGDSFPEGNQNLEINTPWLTTELDRARSELFIEAMRLHEDFILHNASKFKFLMSVTFDLMLGKKVDKELSSTLWSAFFMVVPLVSSTFASATKLFAGLHRESLGWVIVDEAGQAKPQQAVGIFQLAQNALVVGDPLQLQPVVTLPDWVGEQIASKMGISSDWQPPDASVQSVVDRVSADGTFIGDPEEGRWVSAPLRVHRRCDEPMFSISNEVAYDNAMLQGVKRDEDPRFMSFNESGEELPLQSLKTQWFHVASTPDNQKVQEEEIHRLKALLTELNTVGVLDSEIMVISPFKKIATRLAQIGKERGQGLQAGTIHSTQGKEATAVILVLGTGKNNPGARSWAAQSPNLLNVAVSRAKRRLYVIGDREEWGSLPYFSTMNRWLGR